MGPPAAKPHVWGHPTKTQVLQPPPPLPPSESEEQSVLPKRVSLEPLDLMHTDMLCFRLAWGRHFLLPSYVFLLEWDGLSHACSILVLWKYVIYLVSQVHSWTGILSEDESKLKSHPHFTWWFLDEKLYLKLQLILAWVKSLWAIERTCMYICV